MTDKQLLKFARAFRNGIIGKGQSRYMCAAVSMPLCSLLALHGIEAEVVESDLGEINHVWIRLADGRALDPTADQFNDYGLPRLPPVYLGPPLKIHPEPFMTHPRAEGR